MQRKNAPETQFSLVNDTTADQKTFGEPNANLKTFGKSNATVKLRLAAAKFAFPHLREKPKTGSAGKHRNMETSVALSAQDFEHSAFFQF